MTQSQLPHAKGWKSRKLWVFLLAFSVMCIAGFLGVLTMPFVIGLIVVPASYGVINIQQKKMVSSLLGGMPIGQGEEDGEPKP